MLKWPQSRGQHALISLLAGSVTALAVAIATNENAYARLVRKYPRDGQDGLGAMMEAFEAGVITFVVVAVVLYLVQRALTSRRE